MRIARLTLAGAVLLAVLAPAGAQEALPVLGQGNVPCSSWLERRGANTNDEDTMTAWILGYMTAFNQYAADPREDVSGGQDTAVLTGRIDEYCRENSTANLYQAAAALVAELRQNMPGQTR